jgi:parvulin-like peptidyl-prolyl isomerase
MIKYFQLILAIFFLSKLLFAQEANEIVAKAGNRVITEDEFKQLYELMPHLSEHLNIDTIKSEFLYSLIAEKLWAAEAAELRLDTLEYFINSIKPIEKLFVRDALYKDEVETKISISEHEVLRGLLKNNIKLSVYVMTFKDSVKAFNTYHQILEGASYDSILSMSAESKLKPAPVEIKYGDLSDEYIEDVLFSLSPGEISIPLKTNSGWFIFKLAEKQIQASEDSPQGKTAHSVREIIKERKAKEIGTKFLKNLFAGITVRPSEQLFFHLADYIGIILQNKNPEKDQTGEMKYFLNESDILTIIDTSSVDFSRLHLVDLNETKLTVKDFLYELIFAGFGVKQASFTHIINELNLKLKSFIEKELITAEAYKRGLNNHPEVRREMVRWEENYLAQLFSNRFVDSVKVEDYEIEEFYNSIYKAEDPGLQVNILEILVDDLDVVKLILDDLKNEKDFRELALHHTKREWTKNKGGEFGYFPVSMFGEIGRISAGMRIDEVYGPIKVPEGYSIVKLLDKKKSRDGNLNSYEDVKDLLHSELLNKKLEIIYNRKTAEYADKYGLKINYEVLKQIKVSDLNMFTHRYMGFGGRIAAVPYTTPRYRWIYEWMKNQKILP